MNISLCLPSPVQVFFCQTREILVMCFMDQAGGKALVMEAEATSQLQKLGILPTDDKPKYIWHKVIAPCYMIVRVS